MNLVRAFFPKIRALCFKFYKKGLGRPPLPLVTRLIIASKNENVGQTHLKKHFNYTILVKYCVIAIKFIKFCLYNIHSARNNLINLLSGNKLTYWWNKRFMQPQCGPHTHTTRTQTHKTEKTPSCTSCLKKHICHKYLFALKGVLIFCWIINTLHNVIT